VKVSCKSCGATVPAENLNLDRMVAKCGACHAVFSFAIDGQQPPSRDPEQRDRGDVPRPETLQIERFGGELTITRRWWSTPAVVILTIFTIIWNGISWGGFVMVLEDMPPAALFIALFLLIGLLMGYFTLCLMLNSTVITVGRELVIRHGPLPVPGNRRLAASDLDQLYVTEHVSTSRSDSGRRTTQVSYQLRARLQDGSGVKLLRAVTEAEEALYLEQLIEEELGIVDEPVRGEV